MKDYYKILGVNRWASSAEIKSAYRRLSMKYHPDRHGGSKIYKEKFIEITEAYNILRDSQSRRNYDLGKTTAFKPVSQRERRRNYSPEATPEIKRFYADRTSFHQGEIVTFTWWAVNCDRLEIRPFGFKRTYGSASYRLKNIYTQNLKVELVATNSFNGKTTKAVINLKNKTYPDPYFHKKSDLIDFFKIQDRIYAFKERMGRKTYLQRVFVGVFIFLFTTVILSEKIPVWKDAAILLAILFCVLFEIWSARRLRDLNMSPWWLIGILIPYLNLIFLLILFLIPGSKGVNRYGPVRNL